jgi:hypothetical protein
MNPSRNFIGQTVTFMRAGMIRTGDTIMVADFTGPDFTVKVRRSEWVGDDVIISGVSVNTNTPFESTQSVGSAVAVMSGQRT